MDLVKRFAPQANNDGLFLAEINFSENFMGKDFGSRRGKETFFSIAQKACYEVDIVMGYEETSTGFKLGFETKADHDRFMAVVEPRMSLAAEKDQRSTERLLKHMDWFEEHASKKATAQSRDTEPERDRQLSSRDQRMLDWHRDRAGREVQERERENDHHLER